MTLSHLWNERTRPEQLGLGDLESSIDSSTWFVASTNTVVSSLLARLSRDDSRTANVTFFATAAESQLPPLTNAEGWIVIAKHILQTDDISTAHYMLVGVDEASNVIGTAPCLKLISCACDRQGAEPAPSSVTSALMRRLIDQDVTPARTRHLARLKDGATPKIDTVDDLTIRLNELDEAIATVRSDLRVFTKKSAEYLRLQAQLTELLRKDRIAFVQRRRLRAAHYDRLANPVAAQPTTPPITELVRHLVTIRWRLEA